MVYLRQDAPPSLPSPPAALFLVGIGGVGMSGLAQLLCRQGYRVSGSDRLLDGPGREALFAKLRQQRIQIWPQDGTGVRQTVPDLLIYSSAVEADNSDLQAAAGVPVMQRANALAAALNRMPGRQIAIAGSCGKTTVTGWTAAALRALGHRVCMVCGGFVREYETRAAPGNFFMDDQAEWLVVEVDESDGSLVAFTPDYGVLLNIGTDHYERDRLVDLFSRFLRRCRSGVVLPDTLHSLAEPASGHDVVSLFAEGEGATPSPSILAPTAYHCGPKGIEFDIQGVAHSCADQFGRHSAVNASAVLALLRLTDPAAKSHALQRAIAAFSGIRQRFERVGVTGTGAVVCCDYAHNVEKICAALRTAREVARRRVLAVFQPHGYGPLEFMRTPLKRALQTHLRKNDELVLLPVYYAGGTTSFQPTSEAVAAEYAQAGLPVRACAAREEAVEYLQKAACEGDLVLVMGARDPTLQPWTEALVQQGPGDHSSYALNDTEL